MTSHLAFLSALCPFDRGRAAMSDAARAARQVIALALRLKRRHHAPALLFLVDAVAFAAIDFAAPGKATDVLRDAQQRVDHANEGQRIS